jgi:hypothetical protein
MLLDSLKAVAGILLLMAVWFAVQAFLRKRTAPRRDADVLEDMVHGCGACGHAGSCSGQPNSKEEIHQCRS